MGRTFGYRLGEETLVFDSGRFNVLFLGLPRRHGETLDAAMARFGEKVHASVSTVKDWRRGSHAPSDIETVFDIEKTMGLPAMSLLKPTRNKEKIMPSAMQIAAYNNIRVKILNFIEVATISDYFVWPNYEMKAFAPSLMEDITDYDGAFSGECPEGCIRADNLLVRLKESAYRELVRNEVFLSPSLSDALAPLCTDMIDRVGWRDGAGDWYPDPDMIFEVGTEKDGPCEMAVAVSKLDEALDSITKNFLAGEYGN